MFLDPTDEFSVWIWYHDGTDVERLADSFEQWLQIATLSEDEDVPGDEEDQAPHPPTPSPRSEEKGRLVVGCCCPAPCGEEMVRQVVMLSMLLDEEKLGGRLLCFALRFPAARRRGDRIVPFPSPS